MCFPLCASPSLVTKKNGSPHGCVDYNRLNAVLEKDSFPLPRTDDIFDDLGDATVFSTFDLQMGYWQYATDPECRAKTAFSANG